MSASDKPLVLISGGVGITPTLPMLEAALDSGRLVHFIHCARNGAVHAFRDWVDELAARHPQVKRFYCYAEDDGVSQPADAVGLLSADQLGQWLPQERDVDAYFLARKPSWPASSATSRAWACPSSRAATNSSARLRRWSKHVSVTAN